MSRDVINYFAIPGIPRQNLHAIIHTVCSVFGVKYHDVVGKSRERELVDARLVIAHLLRKQHAMTWKRIGEMLGGKDHTSAIHYVNTSNKLLESDEDFTSKFNVVRSRLAASARKDSH